MRCWFSRSYESFSLPYTIINFLFAFLKLLAKFEMRTKTIIRIPFSVIDRKFSSADLSLAAGEMRKN
jgi:hypothetical protein